MKTNLAVFIEHATSHSALKEQSSLNLNKIQGFTPKNSFFGTPKRAYLGYISACQN